MNRFVDDLQNHERQGRGRPTEGLSRIQLMRAIAEECNVTGRAIGTSGFSQAELRGIIKTLLTPTLVPQDATTNEYRHLLALLVAPDEYDGYFIKHRGDGRSFRKHELEAILEALIERRGGYNGE